MQAFTQQESQPSYKLTTTQQKLRPARQNTNVQLQSKLRRNDISNPKLKLRHFTIKKSGFATPQENALKTGLSIDN